MMIRSGIRTASRTRNRPQLLSERLSLSRELQIPRHLCENALTALLRTLSDTKRLVKLFRERDKTLNALERSETLYIESFWLSKHTVSPGDSSGHRMPSRTASRRSTHSVSTALAFPENHTSSLVSSTDTPPDEIGWR
jgi:hypothetical protein